MIKRQKISGGAAVLITILIVLGILLFQKPTITGRVVQGKETIYSENLNIEKNESGTYEWKIKNPGNIKSLKATGSVTSNGTARVYIENNGTRQLLFDSTKQLFDVDIHVLPEYKKIFQGDKILIQNVLFNLRGFGAGNVNVKYSIKDSKGNLIAAEEESVFVETQTKFIRELIIPAEIKAGTYVAFVEASTNGTTVGTGSDTFEVKAKYEVPYYLQLKSYIIAIAVIVALVIAFILGIYGLDILKKKQKITELKEKKVEEKVQRLEKELKALEEARRSGFISVETYQKEKKRIEERLRRVEKAEIDKKIIGKSKNFDKFYTALLDAEKAIDDKDTPKAKKLYYEARDLYIGLANQEKQEVHEKLLELYKRMNQLEKK